MENISAPIRSVDPALTWFSDPSKVAFYDRFQQDYLSPGRNFYMELALALYGGTPSQVLEIGCGLGDALFYLRERIPDASLTGIDPSQEMIARGSSIVGKDISYFHSDVMRFDPATVKFDLILSYSNFRFWTHPTQEIEKLNGMLAPGGLCYISDLRRDMPNEIREQMIARARDTEFKEFLVAQIDSAYSLTECVGIRDEIDIPYLELSAGGIAGRKIRSPEAFRLIQSNDHLANALFSMPSTGFRIPGGEESLIHFTIHKPRT